MCSHDHRQRGAAPQRMSEGQTILVKWMSVTDADNDGHIRAGTVITLCDEAAGLAGIRHE